MPPVVQAAVLTAAAMAYGSHKSSKSSDRATDASMDANREALEYTKQQEELSRAEEKAKWDAYQAQLGTYYDKRAPYENASNSILNESNARMGYPQTKQTPRTIGGLLGGNKMASSAHQDGTQAVQVGQPDLRPGANPYAPIERPEEESQRTIEQLLMALEKTPRRLRRAV